MSATASTASLDRLLSPVPCDPCFKTQTRSARALCMIIARAPAPVDSMEIRTPTTQAVPMTVTNTEPSLSLRLLKLSSKRAKNCMIVFIRVAQLASSPTQRLYHLQAHSTPRRHGRADQCQHHRQDNADCRHRVGHGYSAEIALCQWKNRRGAA